MTKRLNRNSVSQGESTLKPYCLFPRDKLYTNPSFVVAFLNPCFSPFYLKVYSDTKSIFIVKISPIKLEQIWPKNTFLKYADATIRASNSSTRAPIFQACQAEKTSVNSGPGQHHSSLELTVSRNLNFSNFESLSQHSQ